jgi:hypothetical protein
MEAEALDVLTERGLHVITRGDRLVVSPKDRIDDELRAFIRARKPEIMAALRGTVHGILLAELRELAGDDWLNCEADPATLESFALAVATRRQREQGVVPVWWTATTICAVCGPVPVWPECPPTVLACPWCLNRRTGTPMPS